MGGASFSPCPAILRCEFGEVQVKLFRREIQSVLVNGLDTLRRKPQPHPSVALLPIKPPLLEIEVLYLKSAGVSMR